MKHKLKSYFNDLPNISSSAIKLLLAIVITYLTIYTGFLAEPIQEYSKWEIYGYGVILLTVLYLTNNIQKDYMTIIADHIKTLECLIWTNNKLALKNEALQVLHKGPEAQDHFIQKYQNCNPTELTPQEKLQHIIDITKRREEAL